MDMKIIGRNLDPPPETNLITRWQVAHITTSKPHYFLCPETQVNLLDVQSSPPKLFSRVPRGCILLEDSRSVCHWDVQFYPSTILCTRGDSTTKGLADYRAMKFAPNNRNRCRDDKTTQTTSWKKIDWNLEWFPKSWQVFACCHLSSFRV